MTKPQFRSWQSVQEEVLRRIHAREWTPGALIPNEADLAEEFGCSRATVNRALRTLAETGLLDRRRKAGTRVAAQPVAKATLDISVIRMDVEARGQRYDHQLTDRATTRPPMAVSAAMQAPTTSDMLFLKALHLADGQPYALEDRWVNLEVVPEASEERFDAISSNEWLLRHAPYTHGDIAFSAANATEGEAQALGCAPGAALFIIDRLTWNRSKAVTKVRIVFAPGHQMRTVL
ncbi:GntR family transcriptional regulator [Loktanella sp. Alg231-35]|uniref:GntR family transcriptional regulator n=1 Tax=Loktanella sp. Alg231-35 TaxID=1922220 RepID=UPI000D5629EE|nr:GntR family transcriptional regulator [Loktanella sp. Alg231-35]